MPDREKVIRALEMCGYKEGMIQCDECPYDGKQCWTRLKQDAIALLKEMEPRVIAFQEIDNFEVLWLEVRDVDTEEGLAPWVKTKRGRWFSPLLCTEMEPDMILTTPEEYGRDARCWTSRPSEEQREAEMWE